jgi:hypothetical protein
VQSPRSRGEGRGEGQPRAVNPHLRASEELTIGWIGDVRSSRQPLRGFLRMRTVLEPIEGIPHAEERPKSLPQARTGGASRSTSGLAAAHDKIWFLPGGSVETAPRAPPGC